MLIQEAVLKVDDTFIKLVDRGRHHDCSGCYFHPDSGEFNCGELDYLCGKYEGYKMFKEVTMCEE